MMTTLDGKIGSGVPGVDIIDDYMDVYRQIDNGVAGDPTVKGNAWVCGRVTSQLYFAEGANTSLPPLTTIIKNGDFVAQKQQGRYFVTTDIRGTLRWKTDSVSFYHEHGNLHLVILVTESTPKEYLSYLQSKSISYLIGGKENVDLPLVLSKLQAHFHINTVLLEGGGKINGSFLKADLIDEIYLLVLPRVLGDHHAPTIFDSNEAHLTNYELIETKPMDRSSVLLHYKKTITRNNTNIDRESG
ncbi:dihydrofolate reductase family protein [Candidatus Gottesmanbacteria bacterium]|nr:dihydrofolate reductase family protein [Candidatus Gottesmanbacteria bacterium]